MKLGVRAIHYLCVRENGGVCVCVWGGLFVCDHASVRYGRVCVRAYVCARTCLCFCVCVYIHLCVREIKATPLLEYKEPCAEGSCLAPNSSTNLM